MIKHTGGKLTGDVAVGELVAGKFRVEGVIGAGGMGVVLAATHVVLGGRFALKYLRRDDLNDEVIERFMREARAAARIKSPHVARVLDVGMLASGAPYLVMEYLEGLDLDRTLSKGGPLAPADVALYGVQTCEGLAAAHALGIIHRDIKPSNLFVARDDDSSPVIKVLDFGVSKHVNAGDWSSLTKTRHAMGTPLYMSPEQMRSARSVDPRSDLWSLGVVLYQLLTGRMPFEAETLPELVTLLLDPSVKPAAVTTFRPETPAALEEVVLRCLEREPKLRPADAAELAAELAPFAGAGADAHVTRARRILSAPSPPDARQSSEPPPIEVPTIRDGMPVRTTATAFGNTARWRAFASRRVLGIAVPAGLLVLGSVISLHSTHVTTTGSARSGVPELREVPPAAASPGPTPIVTPVAPTPPAPVRLEDIPVERTPMLEPPKTNRSRTALPPSASAALPNPSRSAAPSASASGSSSGSGGGGAKSVDLSNPYEHQSLASPYR